MENASTIWIIGLDGATFDLIEPWIQAGELPTFERLLREGSSGELLSAVPQSPPAWASFMTGKNPGQHGVYEFVQPQRNSYQVELVNGSLCRATSFWEILSQRGRRVGVVNVPMTFPPRAVNGFLISGFDTPYGHSGYTHPAELHDEIQQRFGQYTFFPPIAGEKLERVIDNFLETIDLRERILRHLLAQSPCDLLVQVFNATDSTQHLCYNDDPESPTRQALLKIYQRFDRFLADLWAELPKDGVLMVLSDHGAGTLHGYINLDNWLAANGWLRYSEDGGAEQRHESLPSRLAASKGLAWAKALLPASLKRKIKEGLGWQAEIEPRSRPSRLNWAQTQAFTYTAQGVYINLQGRQPQGVVAPGAEYEALCSEITERLYALRDPDTGQPVVDKIYRKEELFSGPYVDIAPDLYIHWADDAYLSWSDDEQPRDTLFRRPRALALDEVVPEQTKTVSVGNHRRQGILLMAGQSIAAGRRLDNATLIDVAPTALALMGQPVPADMDGRVLTQAFAGEIAVTYSDTDETPVVDYAAESAYSDEDMDKVEARLRELGYL